jgi:purine nucleosidase
MGLPLYLDCDPGIDDALALAYLVAAGADLRGVGAVHGNVSAERAAQNALGLLELLGRPDVPVALGAAHPVNGFFRGGSPQVHGSDGIGGVPLPQPHAGLVDEHADAMLVRLAHEHPGELHVLAIGPLTNLALALEADPELPALVAGVTVMGGAVLAPGNVTALAEANVFHDVDAAARVLEAGWSVTLVPLDVTMLARFEQRHLQALAQAGPAARALAAMSDAYADYYAPVLGQRACALHDPLAAAVALGEVEPVLAPVVPVEVDTTEGPGRGQTIADLRSRFLGYPALPGARHRVVLEAPTGFGDLLTERILALPR